MQELVPKNEKKNKKRNNQQHFSSRFFNDYDVNYLLGAVSLFCYRKSFLKQRYFFFKYLIYLDFN